MRRRKSIIEGKKRKTDDDFWKDEWSTPAYIYGPLNEEFKFDLDPCANAENHKTDFYYDLARGENGLELRWIGERVFVNPPYSNILPWVEKALSALFDATKIVVFLLPVRSDNDWWRLIWQYARHEDFHWYRNRIEFDKPAASPVEETSPRFPSFHVALFNDYVARVEEKEARNVEEGQGFCGTDRVNTATADA